MNTSVRLFFICISSFAIVSCSEDGATIITAAEPTADHDHPVPTVSSTSPVDLGTAADTNGPFNAVFDQEMFAVSLDNNSFTLTKTADSSTVSGSVSFDFFGRTASFTPDSQLPTLTSYTATLNTGVSNLIGTPLAADYSCSFTTADFAWGTAGSIEISGAHSSTPQIASDNSGNIIAVWVQGGSIWSSRFDGTAWGSAEPIGANAGGGSTPQIAIDNSGNAIAVWQQSGSIWANRFDSSIDLTIAATGWGSAELIEANAGNASDPQIAFDNSGNALAIWQQTDDIFRTSIFANRFDSSVDLTIAATGWGNAELVEIDDTESAFRPQITFDNSGNAIAVWVQQGTSDGIWVNHFDGSIGGTGWGSAELISANVAVASAWLPQIAIDSNGNALAVWSNFSASGNIYANRFDGSNWGSAELIQTVAGNPSSSAPPQIAFDNSGNALAIWQQYNGSTGDNIWANRFDGSSGGTGWGSAELVETDDVNTASDPQIAFDSRGNALAVWVQFDSSNNRSIMAKRFIGTSWGTVELVETIDTDVSAPQIVFDNRDHALVVWQQYDSTRYNIWANRFE